MSSSTADAAAVFAASLVKLAEMQSNAVLQVIDATKPLEENKKYPPGFLQFSLQGLRAYYHCHPASRKGVHRFPAEHGHFHIFIRIADERWLHLVALSMDSMGQPLGWFTVNLWVSGESWLAADELVKKFNQLPLQPADSKLSLVEQWLLSLLLLEKQTVISLIKERDRILEEKKQSLGGDIQQDRSVYLLSQVAIDNVLELLQRGQY